MPLFFQSVIREQQFCRNLINESLGKNINVKKVFYMRWLEQVSFKNLHPAMVLAAMRLDEIYTQLGEVLWITSGNDSKHMENSKHYSGRALDFRTKTLTPIDKSTALTAIKNALGAEYTVLLEDLGGANEHLHIQYNND